MSAKSPYCPPWSWWIRGGERLSLGLDIRRILEADGTTVRREVVAGLKECGLRVGQGCGIVDAMKFSGMRLPLEAWCLLEAGERTGRTGEAMIEVGNLLRESESRRRELVGQIWYPAVVLLTGFIVMLIILVWVVPQMREISLSVGQDGGIPWLTENIGRIYGACFAALAGTGLSLCAGWTCSGYAGRRSAAWATRREAVAARIPVFGPVRIARREARILRQLSTLLQGGITLPDSLAMMASRSPDQYEHRHLMEFRKRLLMGISFEDSIGAFPLVRRWNHPLLVTGQESGKLDVYLHRLAVDLDREVSWKLEQVLRFLEPATIFCLAILIAGLVLAYMLPMIRMMEQLA